MLDYKPIIPIRLRYYREKFNHTQQEIAQIINVAQNTYCQWENGKRLPSIEKICQIADYYDTSVDKLLGRTDINN